jgi:hypothetical protein
MNNTTKGREEFIVGTKGDFNFSNNSEGSVLSKIDPKLIEAFLTKEIAKVDPKKNKSTSASTSHQITIFADRDIAGNFQMMTIPLVGDEIAIHNRNGREQVYKVVKVRHSAYFSTTKLDDSASSNVVVWCELVQKPVKVGLIF